MGAHGARRARENVTTTYQKLVAKAARQKNELALETKLREAKIEGWTREVPFGGLDGTREWRFDFGFRDESGKVVLAVEVQGGLMIKGSRSHGSPQGAKKDYEKLAHAGFCGILCIQVTPGMIADGAAVELIQKGLEVVA